MKKNQENILLLAIAIVNLILVFLNKSTYDSGDSILHYVQSHQALYTPRFFLHHWGKPVFILLSTPFSVWGWWGMKLFNTFCIMGSTYLTYLLFSHLKLNKWWAVLLCLFAPHFFLVQSSGLTEPLFALFLIAAVYFSFKERYVLAAVLLSFLPMVRSEGWVVMIIFLVFLIAIKQFRRIPLLTVGTAVYSFVGLIVKGNFLWLFNENPYAGIEQKYGSGNALHYVEQLPYIIGLPIFILFALGIFWGGRMVVKNVITKHEFYLVYGITIGYIVAHSIWWRYGIFHSYGMNRVLIVLIPLIAVIAYRGLEQFKCSFYFVPSKVANYIFLVVIVVFPFTANKMAMGLPGTVSEDGCSMLAQESVEWLEKNNYDEYTWYLNNFHVNIITGKKLDYKNETYTIGELKRNPSDEKSIIIWDSYFAPTDSEVSLELVESWDVKFLQEFNGTYKDMPYSIRVYELLNNNYIGRKNTDQ